MNVIFQSIFLKPAPTKYPIIYRLPIALEREFLLCSYLCFYALFQGRFDVTPHREVRLIDFLCTIPIQARRLGKIFYSSVSFLLNLLLVVLLLVLSLVLLSNHTSNVIYIRILYKIHAIFIKKTSIDGLYFFSCYQCHHHATA